MEATPKALALAFAATGMMLLAVMGVDPPLTAAAGAVLLVVLAYMSGVSTRASRALEAVEVERRPRHARVVEGEEVEVELVIRNGSGQAIYTLTARDGLPDTLAPQGSPAFSGPLEPGGSAVARYALRPPPGLHRIEYTDLEAGDPLGLFKSGLRVWVTSTIQAYPRPLRSPAAPASRIGLAEAAVARRRGWGLEFYSLRDYQPGDDVRLIAWLPSARSGRLVVRENVEERALDLCVFLDLSLESWAGGPWGSAAEWIMRAALGLLGASASTGGWACYTVYTGESALRMPPTKAPDALEWLAEQLSSTSPTHAVARRRLGRAVERFEAEVPRRFYTIYLLGPGASEAVAEALAGSPTRWRALVVEVLPTGGGLAEALEEAYRLLDSRGLEKLRLAGVPAYMAAGPASLAAALEEGLRVVTRRAPGLL